jgi:hypothetical protein
MYKRVISLLLNVSVWVPLLAVAAQAQGRVKSMQVQVSFAFSVRDQQFAAGKYALQRENGFLYLRDEQGRVVGTVLTNPVVLNTAPQASKVLFYPYHGRHLLTRIQWEGDSTGSELVAPGKEQEVAARLFDARLASARASGR